MVLSPQEICKQELKNSQRSERAGKPIPGPFSLGRAAIVKRDDSIFSAALVGSSLLGRRRIGRGFDFRDAVRREAAQFGALFDRRTGTTVTRGAV